MKLSTLHAFVIKNRRWVAASIMGLAIVLLVNHTGGSPKYRLVITTGNFLAGRKISSADLKVVQSDLTWSGTFSAAEKLVGRRLRVSIQTGQPLVSNDLLGRQSYDPRNRNCVLVTLPSNVSGSNLTIGNRVDIFVATDGQTAEKIASSAYVVDMLSSASNSSASYGRVLLAVNPNEVQQIATYGESAQLTYALLN